MDLRLRRHDGQYRWMLDNGVPRFGADGAAIGYVGSCVDIHERKELEESLAERTQQLRLAERRQGQFLAMLSHELRNPLAPIANAASVLRTLESTNPILVRLREILERQVARLGHLIEELIDVTRAAQGQITLVREQVSIESVVQAAVAASHDKLTAAGHRLDVDVPTSGCSFAATAAGSRRRSRTSSPTRPSSRSSRAPSRSASGAPPRRFTSRSRTRARGSTRSSCRTPSSCSRSRTRPWRARSAASASA
jgi:signal transduction histidine kinase